MLFLREVNMRGDIQEILLTGEEIQAKVIELGEQVTTDYQGKNLLLLGTLKGAVPFIADLARAINLPLEIDYMAISSYGNSTQSSGVGRILKDLEGPGQTKHRRTIQHNIHTPPTPHHLIDVFRPPTPPRPRLPP